MLPEPVRRIDRTRKVTPGSSKGNTGARVIIELLNLGSFNVGSTKHIRLANGVLVHSWGLRQCWDASHSNHCYQKDGYQTAYSGQMTI